MNFFRPNANGKPESTTKLTGANIHASAEERLKQVADKRKERREKINEKSSYFKSEDDSYVKETDTLRKNKDLSRKDYRKQERRDISRLGLRPTNTTDSEE